MPYPLTRSSHPSFKPPQRRIGLYLLLLLLSLLWAGTASAERPVVGATEIARNQAEAIYSQNSRALVSGAEILMQDTLKTGLQSRLQARLLDESVIVMGESTELLVDEFVYAPAAGPKATLELLRGALLYVGGHLSGDKAKDIQVKTPVALLGVRGTRFWVGPIDGATGVLVIQGRVDVNSRFGLVTLRPGEGTMVQANGELSHPKTWGEEKKQRALAMTRLDQQP